MITAPEPAGGVAVAVVPLAPACRKLPKLIAAHADVPRFGDELERTQDRILCDCDKQRMFRVKATGAPPQRGGKIKAEAVNPALFRETAQAVHCEPERGRPFQCQRVAAACVIDVMARIGSVEAVVAGIVQPAQRHGGAELVTFARMVEHHVDKRLDAGIGKFGNARAHLFPAAWRKARVWRAEDHRVVAPVVGQPERRQMAFVEPCRAGHQLGAGDAEGFQVLERSFMAKARESSAQVWRHALMELGEATHMQLIQDRAVPWCDGPGPEQLARSTDNALRHEGRTVGIIEAEICIGAVWNIAEHRRMQHEGPVDFGSVRIEQELVRIEAVALARRKRPMCPEAVACAWHHARDMAVEHIASALRQDEARDLAVIRAEQAQHDRCRMGGEHRDIDAVAAERDAERLGRASGELQFNGCHYRTGAIAVSSPAIRRIGKGIHTYQSDGSPSRRVPRRRG